MADEEHVKRLQQGVSHWNKWQDERAQLFRDRIRPPPKRIDLRGFNMINANLGDVNLSGADLREADLRGADLNRANLISTDLHDANLSGADLSYADLRISAMSNANLSGADLSYADLRGTGIYNVNLSGADLFCTDLSDTILEGANLTGAKLGATSFADADLTRVIGLEECIHSRPSIIDHSTLQKSGPLPLAFLRGVGLPDNFIDYLPSLLNQPIQHYSCFISYSSVDDDFAKRIHADLQNSGVRCWFAPHDLPIGAKTWDAIDKAIKLRDKLLLILSEKSIGIDWVEDEVQKAFAEERDRKELVLFPVRIDDAVMQTPEPWVRKLRDQRHIGDFRKWKDHDAYKRSFERVLRDLTKPQS